jgi:hypothetical protein
MDGICHSVITQSAICKQLPAMIGFMAYILAALRPYLRLYLRPYLQLYLRPYWHICVHIGIFASILACLRPTLTRPDSEEEWAGRLLNPHLNTSVSCFKGIPDVSRADDGATDANSHRKHASDAADA